MKRIWAGVSLLLLLGGASPVSRGQTREEMNTLAREILKQLIEINTTDSVGNTTTAAEAMAARLRAAGFAEKDVVVLGPNPRKGNIVARLRGTGKHKPLLLIAHLDVVEARREDWTTDPFQFVEKDGYFYGRGTSDVKEGDAILVANFIRWKREGFVPDQDLILALTADEEGGSFNGIEWLLKTHRELIDAEYCINLDGGEFEWREGKRLLAAIQASEKVYADFQLEAKNPGGHSSRPTRNNAIYHLAGALTRLETLSFPAQVNEITRGYFEHMASLSQGQTAADLKAVAKTPPDAVAVARLSESPMYNTLLRTTCVATMLSGGHAPNALPQRARANVNCRIFPGDDPEQVRQTLVRVIADPEVSVTFVEQRAADGSLILPVTVPPSPLRPDVASAMEKTVGAMWPGIPVVPTMAAGASDGKYLRIAGIPTYVIACMFFDVNDVRAHGKDERIRADFFYEGVDFCDRLTKTIAGPK